MNLLYEWFAYFVFSNASCFCGITTEAPMLTSSTRMVDLFAEWQKYEYFKVKIGQFKNPFTFENPMHPIDQGFVGDSAETGSVGKYEISKPFVKEIIIR